jgi:hypothetical protein
VDNINNVSSDNTNTSARIGDPGENPVMFGFEIVIDSVSSPLLIYRLSYKRYSNISEVASKIPVYRRLQTTVC